MRFPKQVQNLIDAFLRLPGIGPKTAERLAFYLLQAPEGEARRLAEAVGGLKSGIVRCKICKNIAEEEVCEIDQDLKRDKSTILVVESALDVFSFEKTGKYQGVYHVLHGIINPLANIGPDELFINELLDRVKEADEEVKEVILALNPTMEGEATKMYLVKRIEELKKNVKVSGLGVGLPIGGDLQYADETTLFRALEGRREV